LSKRPGWSSLESLRLRSRFLHLGKDACNEPIRRPDASAPQLGHYGCDLLDLASPFGLDVNSECPPDGQAELHCCQSGRSVVRKNQGGLSLYSHPEGRSLARVELGAEELEQGRTGIMRDLLDPIRTPNLSATRKRVPLSHNLVVDEVRNEDLFVEYGKESKLADQTEVDERSGVRNRRSRHWAELAIELGIVVVERVDVVLSHQM